MLLVWPWIPLGVLTLLALYQQARIYRIHRAARKSEELFRIVTENAADMIALVDVKGHRLYNSPAYTRILGYSASELSETSSFEQIHPDDRFRVLEAAREARETGVGQRLEYRIKHKDGSWRVLESVATAIRDDNGEVAKLVIVNRDITERKRAEAQLEHNLLHDPLTGVPNRRWLLDRLQQAFAQAQRDEKRAYALLLVNLDHFKVFNETLGPETGDRILKQIATAIEKCIRDIAESAQAESGTEWTLSRLGGDEFVVLLHDLSDPSHAMRVAQAIQAAVAAPFFIDEKEVRVSASIGIALNMQTHEQPLDVLKDADVAMRRAKTLGGSRSEVSDEAMHSRAEGQLRLEADLRAALAQQQFRIYYQPVVQLNTRALVSFEALLRWEHPTQGLMSPYRFIEAAEDSGILVSVGHWLILQACRQLRDWDAANFATQRVNVTMNVSARQFADARLASDIQAALCETQLDPTRLQLEITESIALADPKLTMTVLSHLKHMGLSIILDDFGEGAMSLRALREFAIDALKIDRSLISQMLTDRSASDLVESIILLAHQMNLQVIAEGIESARQFERLRELKCELGQGFHISHPLEGKTVPEFMMRQSASARGVANLSS